MKIKAIKTRIFQEGENLTSFITSHVKNLPEKSVLVVTSKIVALAEKRTVIIKNLKERERLIKAESQITIPTKYVWLTVKDGMIIPSAGIDESNGNGKSILLPKDSFRSARIIQAALKKKYQLKNLAVIITDSRTLPLRAGVVGVALGYAGFRGIRDYRDLPDIFGRKFKFSRVDVADGLATAAVLCMGEGSEQQPLAIIEEAPIQFSSRTYPHELHIDIKDDMYSPLFNRYS